MAPIRTRTGIPTSYTFDPDALHPFCNACGWRKGGKDSWNGRACKCGMSEPAMTAEELAAIYQPETGGVVR